MRRQCQKCHGAKFYYAKLRDLSGRTPGSPSVVEHLLACDMCGGKGYTDQSDHNRYLRGMGLGHLQKEVLPCQTGRNMTLG